LRSPPADVASARSVVIKVQNVSKTYRLAGRVVHALDSVRLEIGQGEIFCLLGPNGAGKTTLVKIIAGPLLPDQGQVLVHGHDPARDRQEVAKHIGVVFETARNVYGYLSVEQNLRYFGLLNKIPRTILDGRVEDSLSLLELESCRKAPANRLSRGMQQKLALAVALLKDPDILLLDEPTLGLDVLMSARVKGVVRQLAREKGKAILLTTHNMPLAEEMGDRFAFISKGHIVWQGTAADFRSLDFFRTLYVVDVLRDGALNVTSITSRLASHSVSVQRTDDVLAVSCQEAELDGVLKQLVEAGAVVKSVRKEETTLEDIFLKTFGEGGS
jgi:ABC-2 type transport system ATP-binding protein